MSSLRAVGLIVHHFKRGCMSLSKRKYSIKYSKPCYGVTSYNSMSSRKSLYRSIISMNRYRMFTSSTKPPPPDASNTDIDDICEDVEDGEVKRQYMLAPKVRDIRHWDKFEWIYSLSSLCQFIGFLSYDFILLRAFSFLSAFGLMVAHTGRRFFVGWLWAFSFAAANIITLYFMLREKYSHDLTMLNKEQSHIYSTFFEPFGITPLEFTHIIKIAHFVTMPRGETLTVSGLICDKVFVVLSGQCQVLNDNNDTVGIISGGHKKSFVGEIALIDDTQDASTATVKTHSEYSRLVFWNVDDLKYLLKHSKADFRVKLINVFTTSMKIKLMDFNANFNVEKSIEFKQQCLESIVQILLIGKNKLKITESENVDKCQFLIEENELIPLNVDERLFLTQYIKRKEIGDTFTAQLMKKYHIDIDLKIL